MGESIRKGLNVQGKALPLILVSFLALGSVIFAATVASFGVVGGSLILITLLGLPLVYGLIVYPKFGICFLLIAAYLIMWFSRMGIDFPLGTVMDALEGLLIFGLLLKLKFNPKWQIYKNPISIIVLVWVGYNVLQVANPTAESRLAWLYTIRSMALVMLMYFVFLFHINSVSFIRLILKIWLGLAFFAAIYAFKQEYFGFFAFEEAGLNDPHTRRLLFIGGQWRKWSIFTDPVTFSYNMALASILCITLIFSSISKSKKVILGVLTIIFMTSMLFSGTRGANVLVPAALVLFLILKFNKKIFLFSLGAALFLAFLVLVPTGNPTLRRFQSTFKPSEDASFNVRAGNQKRIQPFIQSHPFGGGLGATGIWGVRFSPNSFLASFPPDSGYARYAVELGWIGLLLFCTLMFIVLRTGIYNYYAIRDPELKTYCLAMVLCVFALCIGSYPQEALVQFPSNILFPLMLAAISATFNIDAKGRNQERVGPHQPMV